MKVLITGMGSHHCSRPSNTSFFTVLSDALETFADVVWMSPKMSWTKKYLEQYDLIIFGFLPPTSLNANKLYGATHVLSLMFESPKLKLIVDSPQVWQYKNSIAAVIRDPKILLSKAYERREGFELAKDSPKDLDALAAFMDSGNWPDIFYPALPWNSNEVVAEALRFVTPSQITGLNLDSMKIDPTPPRIGRKDLWAIESPKSSWIESIAKTIIYPMVPTKVGRKTDDLYALEVIQDSIGLLLPPQERNGITWWNHRIVQALNSTTPIATNWVATSNFSPSWSVLAYQVEDMSPAQRLSLAAEQRDSYVESLTSADATPELLKETMIDSTKERI